MYPLDNLTKNTKRRREPSARKHYNLARAKLTVYANRMKAVRHAQRARSRVDHQSEEYERLSKGYRRAVRIAEGYFHDFKLHYNAIPPPTDPESVPLSIRLLELDETCRTVYVMRTGFG